MVKPEEVTFWWLQFLAKNGFDVTIFALVLALEGILLCARLVGLF